MISSIYIQLRDSCDDTTTNYLYNAKFISTVFRERIHEQPKVKLVKLKELVRKMIKFYVAKTTIRREIKNK